MPMADIVRYDNLNLESTLAFAVLSADKKEFDVAIGVLLDAERQYPDNLFVKDALSLCYTGVGAYPECVGILGEMLKRSSVSGEKTLLKLSVFLDLSESETVDLFEIFGFEAPEFGFRDDDDEDDKLKQKASEMRRKGRETRDTMLDAIAKQNYDKAVKSALEYPISGSPDTDTELRDEIVELALKAAFLSGDKELAMAFAVSAYKRTHSFAAADILLRISLDFGNEMLFRTYFDTFFNDYYKASSDLRSTVELIKSAYSLGRYDEAFAAAKTVYASNKFLYDLNIVWAALNALKGDFKCCERIVSYSEKALPKCPFFGYFKEVFAESSHLGDRRDRYIATRLVADDAWNKFATPNHEDDRNIDSLADALRLRLRRDMIYKDLKRPYYSRAAVKANKTLIGAIIAPLT